MTEQEYEAMLEAFEKRKAEMTDEEKKRFLDEIKERQRVIEKVIAFLINDEDDDFWDPTPLCNGICKL
jgi:hypothetical protein